MAGWLEDEVESALIDAVLSIRARYGSPQSGVRGALDRYRAFRGTTRPDDLAVLADLAPDELQSVLRNRQRTGGRAKAEVVVEAARRLSDASVLASHALIHARDLHPASLRVQESAYISVRGLGSVTWSYFTMLLGVPDVKPDSWVTRWVSSALRNKMSAEQVRSVVRAAAEELDVDATSLEHAIWANARGRT